MKKELIKPAVLVMQVRVELTAHNITHEMVSIATKEHGLNANRGYSVQKVKDMITGRVAAQVDMLTVAIILVERSMKRLEKIISEDMTPLAERLKVSRLRREEISTKLLIG